VKRTVPGGTTVLLAMLVACGDPLGKGWLIERPRVLGARAAVSTDDARATPAPGEKVFVDWLVGAPGPLPRMGTSFVACVAPEGNYAEPRCTDAIATAASIHEGDAPIRFELTMPDAREVLVLAAFCDGDAAALDPRAFAATCTNGAEPILATASVRGVAGGANLNPTLAEDTIRFDDAVLGKTGPAPCVPPRSEHAFGVALGAREPGETLVLSHIVNAGTLDRQFSALDAEEAPRTVSVPWTAPEAAGPEPRTVDIYFVLRDGRGGTGFERRTICVRN